jgi:hypothetical protein
VVWQRPPQGPWLVSSPDCKWPCVLVSAQWSGRTDPSMPARLHRCASPSVACRCVCVGGGGMARRENDATEGARTAAATDSSHTQGQHARNNNNNREERREGTEEGGRRGNGRGRVLPARCAPPPSGHQPRTTAAPRGSHKQWGWGFCSNRVRCGARVNRARECSCSVSTCPVPPPCCGRDRRTTLCAPLRARMLVAHTTCNSRSFLCLMFSHSTTNRRQHAWPLASLVSRLAVAVGGAVFHATRLPRR